MFRRNVTYVIKTSCLYLPFIYLILYWFVCYVIYLEGFKENNASKIISLKKSRTPTIFYNSTFNRGSGHISYVKVGGLLFEIYNSRSLLDNTCLHVDMQTLWRRVFMKILITLKWNSLSGRPRRSNLKCSQLSNRCFNLHILYIKISIFVSSLIIK